MSAWSDLGGAPPADDEQSCHGTYCTPRCAELAVPSPWNRPKHPAVRCEWCGALPGCPCTPLIRDGRRRPWTYGKVHPSRRAA